jgi:hypothetical protein
LLGIETQLGGHNNFISCDAFNNQLDFDFYTPDISSGRTSKDIVCNARRFSMLDFYKSTSLQIGNGRIGDTSSFTPFHDHLVQLSNRKSIKHEAV